MSDKVEAENPKVEKTNKKFPKAVYFILGCEFCERFNFYGLQSLLSIYLITVLQFSTTSSTTIYHSWKLLSYFTPIFGAVLADSWFGKFRTIFYLSIVYIIGNIVTCIGSFPNQLQTMRILSLSGLIIVAWGTGGIKPCVSAFGGDQFEKEQVKARTLFFSIFYFAINLGSFLSTLFSPVLRKYVKCMGSDSCYPLALGVPSILMVIALTIFVLGKPLYNEKKPKQNVLLMFPGCICYAIINRFKTKDRNKEHWLDYADDKYEADFIRDAKYVFGVWFILLPLPIFWALYDQQGSKWTFQARQLDGHIAGYEILPEQMAILNPTLILVLIPLFSYVIYPLLEKIHLLTTPLQRVTTGGFFAAMSFLVAGFLQSAIENNLSAEDETSPISIFNQIPQYIIIEIGEVLFSISGVEFAYSQAPTSMKSVLQASWLITVAFGNIIIVIISNMKFFAKQSIEFYAYAAIMALDMFIFGILAYFYKYVELEKSDENDVSEQPDKEKNDVSK